MARPVPDHGRSRYNHRTKPCRCRTCTDANTTYHRAYRARARAVAVYTQLELPPELRWQLH